MLRAGLFFLGCVIAYTILPLLRGVVLILTSWRRDVILLLIVCAVGFRWARKLHEFILG